MWVQHTVQVQVLMYYNTLVDDDTDHPMTDDEIREIAKQRMLKYGPRPILFDKVEEPVEEEDIDRVIPVATENPVTGEDLTDEFIDLQRKLKKKTKKQTLPGNNVLADFLVKL